MVLLSFVKVTGSTIDNHEVLVRIGPFNGANSFGVSLDGRDFNPVDTPGALKCSLAAPSR